MFIVDLKDGSVHSTAPNTDDNVEFWKLLNENLGRTSAELFDSLIASAKKTNPDILKQLCLNINKLRVAMAKQDYSKLGNIINELDEIYKDLS